MQDIDENLSLSILSKKTEDFLCSALNTRMILPTEDGLLRDYRGLAEKLCVPITQLSKDTNPTRKLLSIWYSTNKETYQMRILLKYLEELDRFDVIDDSETLIKQDIALFHKLSEEAATCQSEYENYDATVLYAEEDFEFVQEVVHKMERNYNLKMFVKERDLKGGEFEVESMLIKIAQHCDKLIVVLSPDFLQSPINKYFIAYAQTIAIEQKVRKIIPCMYKKCQMPLQLVGLHTIYYDANYKWIDFWSKLAQSIRPNSVSSVKSDCLNKIANGTSSDFKQSELHVNNCKTDVSTNLRTPTLVKNDLRDNKPEEKLKTEETPSNSSQSLSGKCKSATKKYYKLGKTYLQNLHLSKNDSFAIDKDSTKKSEKSKTKKSGKKKIAVAL